MDTPDREKRGRRLAEARRRVGLSQSQLATRVGLTSQTISLYERGRIVPSAEMSLRIGDELGVSVRWLVTGEGSLLPATGTA
jgi:transcriptional regulator with XRE-family HTH domain